MAEVWNSLDSFQELVLSYFLFVKDLIVIICKETVAVFKYTRKGHHVSLRMVVSHHEIAGIWTQDLWKSCLTHWAISPAPLLLLYGFWGSNSGGLAWGKFFYSLNHLTCPSSTPFVYFCNPSTGEAEAGQSGVQGQPWLHSKFETSLDYLWP